MTLDHEAIQLLDEITHLREALKKIRDKRYGRSSFLAKDMRDIARAALAAAIRKGLSDTQSITDEIRAAVEAERELRKPLEAFILRLFEISGWPEGGEIDGFDFQDAAADAGILTAETRTKPCAESCFCEEYHGDMSDGVTCYRKPDWLMIAAASRKGPDD